MAKGQAAQQSTSRKTSVMSTHLPDEQELELIETDRVSDLPFPGGISSKPGSLLSLAISERSVNGTIHSTASSRRNSCISHVSGDNRVIKTCWTDNKTTEEPEEDQTRDGKSTITKGLLATSGFVWIPACAPSGDRTLSLADDWFLDAQKCSRMYVRRNALADPHKMLFPQETRERLEKEVADRKTSLTRKISQYFRSMYTSNYEVDLI